MLLYCSFDELLVETTDIIAANRWRDYASRHNFQKKIEESQE
jgi:hypothetical protein